MVPKRYIWKTKVEDVYGIYRVTTIRHQNLKEFQNFTKYHFQQMFPKQLNYYLLTK